MNECHQRSQNVAQQLRNELA